MEQGSPAEVLTSEAYLSEDVLIADPTKPLTAEDRYRLLAENASDVVYQTDGLNFVWVSPSVENLLGWDPAALIGKPAASIVSTRQDQSFIPANRAQLLAGEPVYQEILLTTVDGDDRWFAGRAQPFARPDGEFGGFIVGLHDIHDAVVARKALHRSELIYRSAVLHARVGVWLLNPDETSLEVNDAMSEFLGYRPADLMSMNWRDVTHPEDVAAEEKLLKEALAGGRDSFRRTKRYIRADGTVRYGDVTVAVARDGDRVLLITKQVTDITDAVEARIKLTELATSDTLTGLPNRDSVLSELTVGLADVAATQRLGVMCIDIDGFHMINESFGHAAGDAVLAALARRLIAYLPHTLIGRFGGDEFLVIVPAPADRATFERFAAQVHHAVAEPFVVDGRKVMLSASLGAVLSRPDSNAADLLRDADVALSEAKRAGTSQLRVFNEGMASKALKRLIVREELRAAIAAGEFVTHYQPLHQLSDHARVGFEALVRWDHPRDGLLAPAAFLPIAEEFGLIIEIGEAVLRQVCRDISLHSGLVEHVSINVSAVELDQPNWLSKTLAIVQESGVDPARLMFELTETAVMSSRRKLHADLSKLRALGADILVDDFGTGYSSISLLRDLPVSGLKLDRSFVAELTSPTGSTRGLADGLAQLSRSIGIKAIAEGIETAAQRDLLMTLGWTYGQGWLYGKPAPLETWIDL